jgi:hypothetical protein
VEELGVGELDEGDACGWKYMKIKVFEEENACLRWRFGCWK